MTYDDTLSNKELIEFLSVHKRDITQICQKYGKQSIDRASDWEDFFQDAVLAICDSWKDNSRSMERVYKNLVANVCKDKLKYQKRLKRNPRKVVGHDPIYHITYIDNKEK